MNLTELLQKLSYGPLSELSIAGEGSGVVPMANIPKLVLRANDALVQLYTRFPLQLRTVILETVDGIYNYQLAPQFAQISGSTEPNKYLKDTALSPFLDDVLLVTDVLGNVASLPRTSTFTPHGAVDDNNYLSLPLNDREDELSWFASSYDTLAMDYPKTGDRYFVQYRARHVPLPLVPADTDGVQIRIPPVLENALLAYIASKVYGAMSNETSMAKSQQLMTEYEHDCALHEERNTFPTAVATTSIKPKQAGWV